MDLQNAISHIRQLSRNVTVLQEFEFNYRNDFVRLAENTQAGKINLSTNSVRFILANILDNNGIPRNLNYAGYFELIVIGDFENRVRLVEEVAEALTNFYINTEILPRIRPINENYLSENMDKYEEIIRKTTKIYDREENIF
ncbi:hypothetical protein [Corallibacter sp.]|uniref:hypothetical protein n=1 Tax=Corallibacter sp. TaxID=2038084 RepID=UPI003AB7061D